MSNEQIALFTIFGGTGDLAKRKLYPSLFRLYRKGFLKERFAVIGTARREWTDDYFREVVKESLIDFDSSENELDSFASHFYYQSHNVTETEHYHNLKKLATALDEKYRLNQNRIFYLAMAPNFFGLITEHLKSEKIVTPDGFNRLIIEKPFGTDYNSAAKLNDEIRGAFEEDQIFRIDHYLGKEMIQNISAIRFGNNILESLWNNKYIDNVQVTLAEALGVEERGGYYDKSGALKDMIQNHTLQVVSLLAMEAPAIFTEKNIREEKIKALNSVRIYSPEEVKQNFVRGQYGAGKLAGKEFINYRDELNVDPQSETETFVAGKLMIDNFRWRGVPFYVRSGKQLTEKGTRINIVFKPTPINVFRSENETACQAQDTPRNILTIYIQPTEGFSLTLNGKEIGDGFNINPVKMDFRHSADTLDNSPEAYEKLILDCLKGDSTNFTHWDEVAQSWRIVDVIRHVWDQETTEFPNYASGTMGPQAAFDLLERDGFNWIWNPDEWYRERGQLN
ncbi:glucose-6-phosphate dehydrogenase [Vagococcus intermedius]|uniref:Glucose-6-phosphate 1-dehydrogenase n=1 Tax=Vagococcus intermedius TaxID=2991418 RepID=A0AAF0CVX9_9ENTE|nr:glucose-6-phosphate dehydrogenase [Vagococcus intermedius]WEG73868.1 glucose-6-phosphate dehydrogenase [Vagococcus intermedius]WEG75953.1 glucose-6-phosphate dehydrogenase [Vagococcus intermedius]